MWTGCRGLDFQTDSSNFILVLSGEFCRFLSRGMNREVNLVAVLRADRKRLLSSGCYKTRTSRMPAVKMQRRGRIQEVF